MKLVNLLVIVALSLSSASAKSSTDDNKANTIVSSPNSLLRGAVNSAFIEQLEANAEAEEDVTDSDSADDMATATVGGGDLCPPGKEVQIPIASVLHYSDDECSTLDTRESFRGYYTNPDAKPDTPEANYTYFCDPEKLKLGEYAKFGITRLSSCYYNNGGNLYAQPVGMCTSFFPPGGPARPSLSVIITSINHTTWEVTDEVYLGPDCEGEPIDGGTYPNNECLPSNIAGSYQFVIPNAVNIACSD